MNKNDVINRLKNGEIVAIPTDTVYGLFGIPTKEVIDKINQIKSSSQDKKLSIMASSFEKYRKHIDINSQQEEFILKHLPGKFTFIVKMKPSEVMNDLPWSDTIGIRVPSNINSDTEELLSILNEFDFLIATSVNISGQKPLNDYKEINRQFPMINVIKNKELLLGRPTKIYSLLDDDIKIIRK